MKRTLTLLTLLGAIAATPLNATEHWWEGVSINKETNLLEGGYTSYKRSPSIDWDMCWAASAANAIAWWQDRVEENGALIIPEGTPRGYEVWENIRLWWKNKGGFPGTAIQHWMTGWEGLYSVESYARTALESSGIQHGGYYNRLAGANLSSSDYGNSSGANHEQYEAHPETDWRYKYKYTMIQTYRFLSSNAESPDKTLYQSASERIIQYMDDDYAVLFSTPSHAMTVYGVNANEDGLIDKFYISDNNDIGAAKGKYSELSIFPSDESSANGPGLMDSNYWGNSHTIRDICVLRTTGIRFLDYDVRVGKNLVNDNEFLFSHYCNLIVDGEENYVLQYDLRDASVDGSPVDAKKVVPYTVDEGDGFTSYHELYTDEVVTTGDMLLRGGKVTLVNCDEDRVKLDGGGKVAGVIRFKDSLVQGTTDTIQDADRTLVVDRTDTIAREINLGATSGTNTLEVTDGNTARFGKLSGTGDLDKTGLGTAEVTGAVTLQGDIRVHAGSFIFGTDATISETTSLTVDAGAHVRGKEGESLTLTIASGVHENNGVMSLATTMTGGVLKGSGTFAGVTVDNGGTLIVGNSPGRQTYTGDLSVNLGDIVFGVSGWDTAADEDNVGWSSGTYSNVVLNGNSLTLGGGSEIRFGVGNGALAALLGSDTGTAFSMTIATGIGNKEYFTSELLERLAAQTFFFVTNEEGAVITNDAGLNAGDSLNTHITGLQYELVDNTQLCVSGVYWASEPMVPEPATGTMTLLALAGLCARRRRR